MEMASFTTVVNSHKYISIYLLLSNRSGLINTRLLKRTSTKNHIQDTS